MHHTLKLLLRFGTVGFTSARHGATFGARRVRRRWLGGELSVAELEGLLLADLCESLGPAFLKVGQILSTRPDVLHPQVIESLSRLQDRVAPFDSAAIPAIVRDAF